MMVMVVVGDGDVWWWWRWWWRYVVAVVVYSGCGSRLRWLYIVVLYRSVDVMAVYGGGGGDGGCSDGV